MSELYFIDNNLGFKDNFPYDLYETLWKQLFIYMLDKADLIRMFLDVDCIPPYWKIFSENFVPDNIINGDWIFNVKGFKEKVIDHIDIIYHISIHQVLEKNGEEMFFTYDMPSSISLLIENNSELQDIKTILEQNGISKTELKLG